MDTRILVLFMDCDRLSNQLLNQLQNCRDDIQFCVGGDPLKEYLKSCELAEERIKKIKRELIDLQQCLQQLEMQALM